ncbi:hypothetical protein Tco_0073674 [Tanacetum coccineum]
MKNDNLKQVDVTMTKPSTEEPPELELKDLPSHLEYAFLERTDKLPVIISKELKDEEKAALLKTKRRPPSLALMGRLPTDVCLSVYVMLRARSKGLVLHPPRRHASAEPYTISCHCWERDIGLRAHWCDGWPIFGSPSIERLELVDDRITIGPAGTTGLEAATYRLSLSISNSSGGGIIETYRIPLVTDEKRTGNSPSLKIGCFAVPELVALGMADPQIWALGKIPVNPRAYILANVGLGDESPRSQENVERRKACGERMLSACASVGLLHGSAALAAVTACALS